MKELQRLKEKEALQREQTLALLNEAQIVLRLDFEGPYKLHEIEGLAEIALQPVEGPIEDYWRCYAIQHGPDDWRLVIDDVVNPSQKPDLVDFENEVVFAPESSRWVSVPLVKIGGL